MGVACTRTILIMLDWNPRFVVAVAVEVVVVIVVIGFGSIRLSPIFLLCCWLLSSFVVVGHSNSSSFGRIIARAKFVHYHWQE